MLLSPVIAPGTFVALCEVRMIKTLRVKSPPSSSASASTAKERPRAAAFVIAERAVATATPGQLRGTRRTATEPCHSCSHAEAPRGGVHRPEGAHPHRAQASGIARAGVNDPQHAGRRALASCGRCAARGLSTGSPLRSHVSLWWELTLAGLGYDGRVIAWGGSPEGSCCASLDAASG